MFWINSKEGIKKCKKIVSPYLIALYGEKVKALESKDRTQSALINAVKAEIKCSASRRKSE